MRTKHPDLETAINWCTLANAVSYATHVLVVAMLLSQQQMIGLISKPHYIRMVCLSLFSVVSRHCRLLMQPDPSPQTRLHDDYDVCIAQVEIHEPLPCCDSTPLAGGSIGFALVVVEPQRTLVFREWVIDSLLNMPLADLNQRDNYERLRAMLLRVRVLGDNKSIHIEAF